MSWFTELGTAVGGAFGGPIGAFVGGKLSTYAYDKSQPVQGPPTPAQTKRRNEIGALSTAVFTTYAGLKDKKIDMENQNRINSSRAANDQALANQGMDLNKLRDSAEEAGFNPLTVLRATGGAGFNTNVALSAPRLSSPSFWGEFTNNYQTTLQNTANLQNTYANTDFVTKQTAQIGKVSKTSFDPLNKTIPFFITVKGEGGLADFKIINPEIIEASLNEVGGSLSWLSAQYAAQHNVSLSKARVLVGNLIDNHESSQGNSPIRVTELPPLSGSTFNPGPLSIEWFKNVINSSTTPYRKHPGLPNSIARQ